MMETGNGNAPKAVTSMPGVYRFMRMAKFSHKSKRNGALKEQNKTDDSCSLLHLVAKM